MLSTILTKLIDKAIVPAILLLASRVVSIVLVSQYLHINFRVTSSGFIFENAADYVKVNSYSALIMTAMLVIGLLYVILKSLLFHDSHIRPSLASRLFSLRAQSLIQSSLEIYTQGAVWLSYSFLLLIVSGIMSLSKLMYNWTFYIILVVTVFVTIFFVFDIEEEVKLKKENQEEYDMDKSFMELPGELE